ncbi:MAG: tyrosine--tRNA ligase [Bacilli bacterium]|nr:tyrosine--tRNA ligase [Bacilli bacterium]
MNIYEELGKRKLIAQCINDDETKNLINSGKAVFYIGFDPTADSLHVGHLISLIMTIHLQKNNNKAIILLGGGTGYIGDPSNKNSMRRIMRQEEIDNNCNKIKKQIQRIIGNKVIFVNNKKWILPLNIINFLRDVGPYFLINDMLRAKCYQQRLKTGLTFLEFNYLILQSYDFYVLSTKYGCNLQIGGDDQWSNMIGGIDLIYKKTNKKNGVITTQLLTDKNGKKMGKTENGAIWLDPKKTSPFDFYQYWRNIDDKITVKYLKMLTFIPLNEIKKYQKKENINKLKMILAYELTKLVHGQKIAKKIEKTAINIFRKRDFSYAPEKIIDVNSDITLKKILVLLNLCPNEKGGEFLIKQNCIFINNTLISDINHVITFKELCAGILFKKGKKSFLKLKAKI